MKVNKSGQAVLTGLLLALPPSPAAPPGSAPAPPWLQQSPGAEPLSRAAPRAGAAAPGLQLRKAVQTSQSAEGFLLKEMSDGKPVPKFHSPEEPSG